MTSTKLIAFVDELTKTAKHENMGTLLGQSVTKTVKQAPGKAIAKTRRMRKRK
jgi:hypothetical protein